MAFGNSIQVSKKQNNYITMNCRIPKPEYHGPYQDLKAWVGTAIGAQRQPSNSMTVRLALYALKRFKDQEAAKGPGSEQYLADDLARQVKAMAAGKDLEG